MIDKNKIYLMEDDEWEYWTERGQFPLIFMGLTLVKYSSAPKDENGMVDYGALEKEIEAQK